MLVSHSKRGTRGHKAPFRSQVRQVNELPDIGAPFASEADSRLEFAEAVVGQNLSCQTLVSLGTKWRLFEQEVLELV